ncbi:hypothetical protein ACLOJK_038380 [Asimina triloba]
MKILHALLESWNKKITAIEEVKDLNELKVISESGEKPMSSYEIFEKIMGKRPGYIKGYGNIPKVMQKRLTIDWPRGKWLSSKMS